MTGIKRNVYRKTTSAILLVALTLMSVGCGNKDGEAGVPGGGKWVDSDIIGMVKSEDNIRPQDDFAAAANKDVCR